MSRIALLLPRLSRYGGVEQFARRLAGALADAHDVDFICGRCEGVPPTGVRAVVVGRPRGPKLFRLAWFLWAAERARRRGRYDLVLSLGPSWNQDLLRVGGGPQAVFWRLSEQAWPAGLPRLAKRLRRRLDPANWLTALVEARQWRSGCRIVCVSDAVADWVLEARPGLERPEVIYNLPDPKRFAPPSPERRRAARERLGLLPRDVLICTAATNFRLKGTESLVRALPLLPPAFCLLVAGGRAPHALRKLARRLGVQDRLVFAGRVQDMREVYHAADLFALPTYYDACSNAVLEARACGLPALSSDRNGSSVFLPAAWVTHRPDDPEDLARRLLATSRAPRPGPLTLPPDLPAGLEAWTALIERLLPPDAA